MESDNKTCIRSLMLEERGRSRLAPWIVDAKEYISNLEDFKLKHVKRCQNTVAYELSHHARRVNSSAMWLAGVPKCIKHHVLKDRNASMTDNL